ncbi:NAD(P)-binding domain-containing protein [Kribbella sp. NPDC048928]|uniref:NAD(P)-binding domain-containing protein n=1 Tax=Kribbella sp. NPDC048928 TaxID=3364111 RepID=UPI003720A587
MAAGHPTTVWNRTPGRSPELDDLGVTRATNAADAVAASPLVVVCLLVDASVNAVLDDVTGPTTPSAGLAGVRQSRRDGKGPGRRSRTGDSDR